MGVWYRQSTLATLDVTIALNFSEILSFLTV